MLPSDWGSPSEGENEKSLVLRPDDERPPSVPQSLPLDPTAITNVIPFIIQQCKPSTHLR